MGTTTGNKQPDRRARPLARAYDLNAKCREILEQIAAERVLTIGELARLLGWSKTQLEGTLSGARGTSLRALGVALERLHETEIEFFMRHPSNRTPDSQRPLGLVMTRAQDERARVAWRELAERGVLEQALENLEVLARIARGRVTA